MPETSQGDRTNPATPLRLERARDEGDIARSADLAFAIQLCGVIGIIWMLSGGIAAWLNQSTTRLWTTSSIRVDQFDSTAVMQQTIWSGSLIIAPILVLMMLVAVASWWLQTGPLWIVNKPAPDISRMSPATSTSRRCGHHGNGQRLLSAAIAVSDGRFACRPDGDSNDGRGFVDGTFCCFGNAGDVGRRLRSALGFTSAEVTDVRSGNPRRTENARR